MTREELKVTLKKLKRTRKRLDAVEAEYEALKDACRAYMDQEKLVTLTVDGFHLNYTAVVSSNVDVKALKAAMPELCQRFTRTSESRRFCVTLPV